MSDLIPTSPTLAAVVAALDSHVSRRKMPLADSTKKRYAALARNAIADGLNLANFEEVRAYAESLRQRSPTLANQFVSMIKVVTSAAMDAAWLAVNPMDAAAVTALQAIDKKIEVLSKSITVKAPESVEAHLWLNQAEVTRLLNSAQNMSGFHSFKAQSDYVLLAVMVASGLRHDEVLSLTFDQLIKMGDRWVLDVEGKGAKKRIVPISQQLYEICNEWRQEIGSPSHGRIMRTIKSGEVQTGMSYNTVGYRVAYHGEQIGYPDLKPHDLRRTYAEIGRLAGISLEQIQMCMGHSSIETTMRYLNINQDLEITISDFVRVK